MRWSSRVVESEGFDGEIGGYTGDERNAGSFMILYFLWLWRFTRLIDCKCCCRSRVFWRNTMMFNLFNLFRQTCIKFVQGFKRKNWRIAEKNRWLDQCYSVQVAFGDRVLLLSQLGETLSIYKMLH